MYKIGNIVILFIVYTFCGCSSAMQFTKYVKPEVSNEFGNELIEYIGVKDGTSNNVEDFISDFGNILSKNHIAIDKSGFYLGIYSLSEIEKYKNEKRFISFIEVQRHSYTYQLDPVPDLLETTGIYLTCFGLFPIGIPMWIVAESKANNTTMKLNIEYLIYTYDCNKKEVVNNTPVRIEISERFKGKYIHNKTDRLLVDEYYTTIVINELLDKFKKIHRYLSSQQE